MKRIYMRKILGTLFLIAALASCKKDDTLRYNNVTMGNIDGETIISDQGNIFQIAESGFEVDLNEYERVLVACDVLKETAEKTYDIRLSWIARVLEKNVKTMADSTPEEDLSVNDPIVLREIWYSGGYLNMTIETAHKRGSETAHFINLVQEESEKEGTYTFSLRHNAMGETPSENDKDYSGATGYVSFPIAGIIKGDSAKIVLKWKSHKFAGGGYSLIDSEDITEEYDWTRGGHEHAPRTIALKSVSLK